MWKVHIVGPKCDQVQQALGVLEGLSYIHEMHIETSEVNNMAVKFQVTTPRNNVITVSTLDNVLGIIREHVSFNYESTNGNPISMLDGNPIRIFVGGDKSQVGKSTICLGLLGSLLKLGYKSNELAYIKPATQCEESQLVSRFCAFHDIAARPIGPVVFYSGFTRAFLEQADQKLATADLLHQCVSAVEEISKGKRIVIIDGVGYPSVGSICGISNADIAAALQPISIVLVGKKGVGDAVDSYNLNATYFTYKKLTVLGGIFNRLPSTGFYSLENCATNVRQYFHQHPDKNQKAYGFVPEVEFPNGNPSDDALWNQVIETVASSVNVNQLIQDAMMNVTMYHKGMKRGYDDIASVVPIPFEHGKKHRRELNIQWKSRETIQSQARDMGAGSS